MEKKNYILLIVFLSVFVVSLSVCAQTEAVSIDINLSANNVAPESEVEVRLLVTSREPVNAFDIALKYPVERLEFLRASTVDSIVSVWQSLPLADEGNGVLRFVGGMVSPFSGKNGRIITLIFRAKESGNASFVVQKADFALADGKGTPVSATVISREKIVSISPELKTAFLPKIVETMMMQDPLTRTSIVLVKTEDDGAVREIQMRSRQWFSWNDWQRTGFIAEIPKYAWTAQIAAIGWDYQRSETTIYRWNVAALKILLIAVFAAVAWYGGRRIVRVWRKSKKQKI